MEYLTHSSQINSNAVSLKQCSERNANNKDYSPADNPLFPYACAWSQVGRKASAVIMHSYLFAHANNFDSLLISR